MRSTFFGIEIGRTGIQVSQKGLDVTGHNIANVDTLGYTRQRLVTTAYEPYAAVSVFRPVDSALVGSGSHVMILDQIRSSFLDRQFRSEQTLLSYWEYRTQGLTYVESLFEGTEDASLRASITNLFEAFNVQTNEANDLEQRKIIQQAAIALTENFNQIHSRLAELADAQNTAVHAVTTDINNILDEIAKLNKSIFSFELNGDPANDLRDKRNLLVDQLSAYVDVEYSIDADNKFHLSIAGQEVVNHRTVTYLNLTPSATPDPITGVYNYSLDIAGTPISAAALISGELKAHFDLRDGASEDNMGIPYFMEQLNNLARAITSIVNAQHEQGYTHIASGSSISGIPFFNLTGSLDSVTAGNFSVSQAILDDPYMIAASSVEMKYPPGSNDPDNPLQMGNQENMRSIYDLLVQTDHIINVNGNNISIGSFIGYMSGIELDISLTLNHSKKNMANQSLEVLAVDNQRTSLSGVSLDEEMTNLIKYQHAYSGSSRVITAMDEVLEKLINSTGRVGL